MREICKYRYAMGEICNCRHVMDDYEAIAKFVEHPKICWTAYEKKWSTDSLEVGFVKDDVMDEGLIYCIKVRFAKESLCWMYTYIKYFWIKMYLYMYV